MSLVDSRDTRLVPDFMARIEGTEIRDVLELKLPKHRIVISSGEDNGPSAPLARGVSQLLRYRDFFMMRENRRRFFDRYRSCPYEPGLVLVIGRGSRSVLYEWAGVRRQFPRVKVVPYDYVLARWKELWDKWIVHP